MRKNEIIFITFEKISIFLITPLVYARNDIKIAGNYSEGEGAVAKPAQIL